MEDNHENLYPAAAEGDMLIIPDVHGRKFWKAAVEHYPGMPTIFLGDYHDPYPHERIKEDDSLQNFREVLDYAKTHPNVTLLLGNHDLQYIFRPEDKCRFDRRNCDAIRSLILDNLSMYKLAVVRQVGGKTVLFSHAPIMPGWVEKVGETTNLPELVEHLNQLVPELATNPEAVAEKLWVFSHYRGGREEFGSPIWADDCEVKDNRLPGVDYFIFGHTQNWSKPVICDEWANLDVRQAFLLSPSLKITPVGPPIKI